jgi:predicted ATPase
MISKWGVKNFKSILDQDLELAPLTVFTGVNSSGKSAFLHSIAMLSQAARSKDNGIITLKGDLIDLGSFDRIFHENSIDLKRQLTDEIGINCTINPKDDKDEYIRLELGLSSNSKTSLVAGQGLLECKKKKEEYNFSIKWKKPEVLPDNASDLYDEIWKKAMSLGDKTTIQDDKIEVDNRKLNFGKFSFLPERICYRPCDLDTVRWDELIHEFTELIANIPEEKLTTGNEADKYAKKIIENMLYAPLRLDEYDFEKQLFYFCVNNLIWYHYWNKSDEIPILFEKIPYFKEFFSSYLDAHEHNDRSKGVFYNVKLSNWYFELSNQDKDIQEAIKKELRNEDGLIKNLRDNIDNFKKYYHELFLSEPLNIARDYLDNYFKFRIKYLGPLREDPQWKYPLKADIREYYAPNIDKEEALQEILSKGLLKREDEKEVLVKLHSKESEADYYQWIRDVGVKGEKTAFVVDHLNKWIKIENYYSPDFFKIIDYEPQKMNKKFVVALEEWLEHIGLPNDFNTLELEKGKSFKIEIQGRALPQLGTGVSQVLPILVACLSAPVDSTIIIEQPELHLHPKMQSRLADFFIAMALSGRQCLIETHSEYIIEQLRYRIVMLSSRIPLHEMAKIYFVTKHNGISQFKNIEINEFAALEEWPEDFFDESHITSKKIVEEVIKKMEADEQDD